MSDIISKLECETVILNYLNLTNLENILIHNYEIKQKIGEVVGYMGEYYGLKISYSILKSESNNIASSEKIHEEKFFVKLIPVTNPLHKKEIEEKGFFEKEIGIYTNILKELEKYCDEKIFARCLYSRPDMMVLEDLTTKSYRNLNRDENYTIEHFKTVLRSQATLHVSSLVYEQKNGINIGEKFAKYLEEKQVTRRNSWYIAGLEAIKTVGKIHPKYQTTEYQNFLDTKFMNFLKKAEHKIETSKVFRNVLCHRDSWDKNILFKYNNESSVTGCAFVDFQLTRYTPPAADVLFFIYMNTNCEKRKNILPECLQYYFEEFQKKISNSEITTTTNGNILISWIEFQKSCEDIKVIILILCAMCFPLIWLPEGWADQMKRNDQSKFNYYMTVNRNEMIINLINEYDYYKNVLFEAHEELIDYVWKEINNYF